MKVILKQDVKTLGQKGSMHEVNDGYARNFLMPKGLAVEANATNINIMNNKNEADKSKKDKEILKAKDLAKKLDDIVVVIKTKAGDTGKLFGSITNKDISDKLKSDFKLDIDKKKIDLKDSIKTISSTKVEIKLYPGIVGKITVKIEQG